MHSNEKFLNEFCIFYKRIMRIEKYLKDLIISKYILEYQDKAYIILYNRYFANLRKYTPVNFTPFESIYLSTNKTDIEKLNTSIEKLYISELLGIFSSKVFLKNKVRKHFFVHEVKTNSNTFRKVAKDLKEFRNTICHFDIKEYVNDKKRFIDALIFFEKLLECRYKFTTGTIESIAHRLSVKSILELIYNQHPEYFDDDRILVNVFDDIALLANFRNGNLPPYKSIIRAKFQIQSELK